MRRRRSFFSRKRKGDGNTAKDLGNYNLIIIFFLFSIGGNSAKASSGINGAQTKLQQTHSIVDSTELFIRDTLASGEGECQEDLVRLLAHRSADAIDFLQKHSVPLHDVVILGGHSV